MRKGRRRQLVGFGASPGQAIGPAHRLAAREIHVPRTEIPATGVAAELRRFRQALRAARAEISSLRDRLGPVGPDPGIRILDSHVMILQDRELMGEIVAAIKAERLSAAYVAQRTFLAKAHYLESLPSELFRARAADIRDVSDRLVAHLLGNGDARRPRIPEGAVVIATEIAPSEVASLGPERIAAFVTQGGTLVSHVTIMARSRGVPAVVGVGPELDEVRDGDAILVDGVRGRVIVAPNREDLERHEHWCRREARIAHLLNGREGLPAETRDGKRLPVLANIGRPEEADAAVQAGAEGIGLFRTEFFFMDTPTFPDEETQCTAYRRVVEALAGRPVTIRTLDLGGDKQAALMGVAPEGNPYLGLRGVRFCLAHPDVFDTQLRALARVAASGNVRILVPMVGGLDQLRQTRARLKDAAAAVRAKGQTALAEPAIGPMIELPSAVLMGDALAREASFFSIGSNDLIQYTLAVDRGNPGIAQLYDPLDPAVLRAIDMTVRHAHAAGIRVGSCGEMSGELPGLLLLVGLGVDELSVASYLVRRVKAILSQLSARDLTRLAQRCLEAGCPGDVRQSIAEGLGPYPQFRIEAGNGGFRCDWEPKTA